MLNGLRLIASAAPFDEDDRILARFLSASGILSWNPVFSFRDGAHFRPIGCQRNGGAGVTPCCTALRGARNFFMVLALNGTFFFATLIETSSFGC
jgi:hypothetical protein